MLHAIKQYRLIVQFSFSGTLTSLLHNPIVYKQTYCVETICDIIFKCACLFQLVEGIGEIFGTELVQNKIYNFPAGSKAAVFTYQGCTIAISFTIHVMGVYIC